MRKIWAPQAKDPMALVLRPRVSISRGALEAHTRDTYSRHILEAGAVNTASATPWITTSSGTMTSLPPNSERYERGMHPRDEPQCPKHVGGMTVQQSQAFRALPIRGALGHGAAGVVHLLLILSAAWTYAHGWWVAMLVLWCAIAWMDHAALTRLHEAARGMLARRRWVNEAQGILIGTLALTPLSVYRFMHARHHACLGREGDPEFWPYNLPSAPRALRVAYAWAELAFGWALTPALYSYRTMKSWRALQRSQRKRLLCEWSALVAFWRVILAIVQINGWWEWFIVMHLAPAWLAGSMQTVRKFTEHLGMFGDTIVSMTRTVVYRGPTQRTRLSQSRPSGARHAYELE